MGCGRCWGPRARRIAPANEPEVRIAETERLLEMVLASSATGLLITDAESGAVRLVNPAFCEFAGRGREELAHGSMTVISRTAPRGWTCSGSCCAKGPPSPG